MNLSDFFDFVQKYGLEGARLRDRIFYACLIFLATGVFTYLGSNDLLSSVVAGVILSAIYMAVTFRIWMPPRNELGNVGIMISMTGADKAQVSDVRAKFIREICLALDRNQGGTSFSVHEVSENISSRIRTNSDMHELLKKSRSHLLFHCYVAQGKFNGEDAHLIKNQQMVVHKDVGQRLSKQLSSEMSQLFPNRLFVGVENDLLNFEIASTMLSWTVKYVVAIAAYFSLDFRYAINLLEIASHEMQAAPRDQNRSRARRLIRRRLLEIALADSRSKYWMWFHCRDPRNAMEIRSSLDEAEKYIHARSNQDLLREYYSLRAISEFVLTWDVEISKQFILKARSNSNPSWRFSMAFLEAYTMNLESALKYYDFIRNSNFNPDLASQTEEFLAWALNENPEAKQLYLLLGMLNLYLRVDKRLAKLHLESFLEWAELPNLRNKIDEKAVRRAREELETIDT